jgi:hypothetical protein
MDHVLLSYLGLVDGLRIIVHRRLDAELKTTCGEVPLLV